MKCMKEMQEGQTHKQTQGKEETRKDKISIYNKEHIN